jgi:hypothetical protein
MIVTQRIRLLHEIGRATPHTGRLVQEKGWDFNELQATSAAAEAQPGGARWTRSKTTGNAKAEKRIELDRYRNIARADGRMMYGEGYRGWWEWW